MGRKTDFSEKPKKGPGRKSKKQGPPQVNVVAKPTENKALSSRQKKRLKKRQLKKDNPPKPKISTEDSNDEVISDESLEEERELNGFTDDNQDWLKPKKQKLMESEDEDDDELIDDFDGQDSSEGDEQTQDQGKYLKICVRILLNIYFQSLFNT